MLKETDDKSASGAANVVPEDASQVRHILVAVCTRNRPQMLGECLATVLELDAPEGVALSFLVVDNSEDPDMRESNRISLGKLPGGTAIIVAHEPQMGIPFARNRTVAHAVKIGADALVFLDDDQTVPRDWLIVMHRVAREEAADVVKTEVDFVFEGPGRYKEQFWAKKRSTSPVSPRRRSIRFLATNGVWIGSRVFGTLGLRFDEEEGLSGGDDTLFFLEASRLGAVMVETAEVKAFEKIPAEKQRLRWLLNRSFNTGVGRAATRQTGKPAGHYFIAGLIQIPVYSLMALLLVWNPSALVYRLRRITQSVGLMWGAFGHRTEGYRNVVGR